MTLIDPYCVWGLVPEEESEMDMFKGSVQELGKIREEQAKQGLDPLANLGLKRSKKFFATWLGSLFCIDISG